MRPGLMVGKSTLGTLPFVIVGANIAGASGVLIGQAIGGALFAIAGVIVAARLTAKIAGQESPDYQCNF